MKKVLILLFLLLFSLVSCISTKHINLSEDGTLFNNQRSLDVRELEATRILKMNINRIVVREEDIKRLQDLLETNMFFVPTNEDQENQDTPVDTDNLPSFGKRLYEEDEHSSADNKGSPSGSSNESTNPSLNAKRPQRQNPSTSRSAEQLAQREEAIRILEIQAVIRLLSRDHSLRTFLLILEQLTYPIPEEGPDPYRAVRAEALNYVMQADSSFYNYVWQIIQSGRLSSEMRAILLPFFLKIDHGAVFLMVILQDPAPIVVDAAVQLLALIYPNYDNPQLMDLLKQPYNRFLVGPWIFSYEDPEAFRLGINLMNEPEPRVQEATKLALLRRSSPWLVQQSVEALQYDELTPAERNLLIEYIARERHPLAIYYIHELLLNENEGVRAYAQHFIAIADTAYYPYLIEHLSNPDTSDAMIKALLPYTMKFLQVTTAELLLPLLNKPDLSIQQSVKRFFEATIHQSSIQEFLLDFYINNLNANPVTIFIMNLFMKENLSSIVTHQKESSQLVNNNSLILMLSHADKTLWPHFISKTSPPMLQIFLNRIFDLHTLLQDLNQFNMNNSLIKLSHEITDINIALQEQREEQRNLFSQIIQDKPRTNTLTQSQAQRAKRDQLTNELRREIANAPLAQREEFLRYRQTLQNINTGLLSLRLDQRSTAEILLQRARLTTYWLQTFQMITV